MMAHFLTANVRSIAVAFSAVENRVESISPFPNAITQAHRAHRSLTKKGIALGGR
jgi:hypothetical protein